MAGIKIDVKTPAGKTEGSVELPAELFDFGVFRCFRRGQFGFK